VKEIANEQKGNHHAAQADLIRDDPSERKLNIGSGMDIRTGGWTNLDSHDTYGADCIFDLNRIIAYPVMKHYLPGIRWDDSRLPFPDNHFSLLYISHVLEHFTDVMPLLKEFARVTRPGGYIEIKVPHGTCAHDSLDHKKELYVNTFKTCTVTTHYPHDWQIPLELVHYEYYALTEYATAGTSRLSTGYMRLCAFMCNLFGSRLVSNTFIKWLFPSVSIRIIYRKR
jgi:predicted SAM-dependent methyltransferase